MHAAATIDKELRMRSQHRGYCIDPATVIDVSKCGSPPGDQRIRSGIGSLESSIAIHRQQGRFQVMQRRGDGLDVIEHVPLRDEQVFLPVVVEVLEAHAPSRGYSRECRDSGLQAAISE